MGGQAGQACPKGLGRPLDAEAGESAGSAKADGTRARVEIAVPMFGYKTHVSIDRKHGFVRRFIVTSAAVHDGAQMANILDMSNTASDVWADTAYRSKATRPISPRMAVARGSTSGASLAST